MILDDPSVAADAIERRYPRLVDLGVPVHDLGAALEGPGPVGPDAAARAEELGRHLDALEHAIGPRTADHSHVFRPVVAELGARLASIAGSRETDAEGLAHVLRRVETIGAELDARERYQAALEELGRALDVDAAKVAADLAKHIGTGPARLLAAHDLAAARLAALALGADGLAGESRSELLAALDVSRDLPAALAAGDAPARLGPGMVRAVERARDALVEQRVHRRLEEEHAAKVAALAAEERASVDASIAAGRLDVEPPAPVRPRRRAIT